MKVARHSTGAKVVATTSAICVGVALTLAPAKRAEALGDGAMVVAAIVAATAEITIALYNVIAEAAVGIAGTIERQSMTYSRLLDGKTAQDMDLLQREKNLEVTQNARAPINECRTGTIGGQNMTSIDLMNRALRIESGKFTELGFTTRDMTNDAARIIDTHINLYAGPQDVRAGYANAVKDPGVQNGDIKAVSLFDGSSPGATERRNYTFNAAATTNARQYLENAIFPFKTPTLPANAMKSNSGRQYIAMQIAESAGLSMPQYAMSQILAMRQPVAGLGRQFASTWRSMKLSGGEEVKDNVSYMEIMALEAARRYANPQWYVDLSAMQTPIQVAKEQTHINALLAFQMQRLYEQSEITNGLLAQIAAVTVKTHFREPLREAAQLARTASK